MSNQAGLIGSKRLLENKAAETPSSSGLACPEFRLDPNSAGTHLKLTRCNFGLRSFPVTVRHDNEKEK